MGTRITKATNRSDGTIRRIGPSARAGMVALAALATVGSTLVAVVGAGSTGTAGAASAPLASCTLATAAGTPLVTTAGSVAGNLDVLDTSAQVLPAHRIAGASAATLCAARDSYASFQLEVSASGTALQGISMTSSDLAGPGGVTLPGSAHGATSDVQLSREDYVTLQRASDGELDPTAGYTAADAVTPASSRVSRNETNGTCTDTADACRFPDVLIPDRDSLFHEARDAFPFSVPANQDRVVWADIFVPATAAAGTYRGTVTVSQTGGPAVQVPVQLEVVSATLPATSSLGSAFFYGTSNTSAATYDEYAELGLDDRISVVPQGALDNPSAIAPLLNGTDARVQLQNPGGAHAALTDFPMNTSTPYLATYKSLLTAPGVTTRPWAYCDEVGSVECASAYKASATAQWPALPLLAIDAAQPAANHDQADRWPDPAQTVVPSALASTAKGVVDVVQYLDPTYGGWKPAQYTGLEDRSSFLQAWVQGDAAHRQAWAYTSNMSGTGGSGYSCPGAGQGSCNAEYGGFPSYGIDQLASEQLAMGWDLYNDGLNGELYWDVNENPQITTDPNDSHNQYLGLNGDGTLFYPWTSASPSTVGGTDPIPLQSVRLMRIRQGRQDYELLRLAAAQGSTVNGQSASSLAKATFPAVSASAVSSSAFDKAEQTLFQMFALPANPTATVGAHDLNCDGSADFLAVQAGTGNLLFYPRSAGDWLPNAPIVAGSGFGSSAATLTYEKLLLPGDINGDGAPDLIGQKPDGSLWLLPGNCAGRFGTATPLGISATNPVSVGDFNGDGHPDLLDQRTDGTLWLLAGNGTGGFTAPVQVGAGWGGLQLVGAGDLNGDGHVDVVARQSTGAVVVYEGNGSGGWSTVNAGVGTGLSLAPATYPGLYGPGDLTGDGRPDLVSVDSSGRMWEYAGNGAGGFAATGTQIGSGWGPTALLEIAQ